MLLKAVAAALGASLRFNGALSATSAATPVTSATRTISGTGTLLFDTVSSTGGTPQYSKNGGAYANITEGMTLAMTGGDTLAVRASLAVSEIATFNIKNNSGGALIEAASLERI